MAQLDLFALYKLHLVDEEIARIKSQAAKLDPGREIMSKIQTIEKDFMPKQKLFKDLSSEQTALSLQNKQDLEKIAKIESDIYSGKIGSAKEIENFQKEISAIKARVDQQEIRLLEIMEIFPQVKKDFEAAELTINKLNQELKEFQKQVLIKKDKLQKEYALAMQKRPGAASKVEASLLRQYEAIAKKAGGIGMSRLLDNGTCEYCGMILPEKIIHNVMEDKFTQCESCHRILFKLSAIQ